MNKHSLFFHLTTLTRHPCFQMKEAHAEAMRTTLCPGCAHPRVEAEGIDVWLQEKRPPRDKPLNFLWGCGIGLIHRELIELIGLAAVERDLYLGLVSDESRRECVEWRTFHGRYTLLFRGSTEAGYRTCAVCGRNIYSAMGKPFLYPAPPNDAMIYGSNLGGLIVPPEIAERVRAKGWRKVSIEKLPVLDEPIDGLGLLPYGEAVPPGKGD